MLLTLEKHDLKELGVTRFGERAILLGAIGELRQKLFDWAANPIKVEDVDVEIVRFSGSVICATETCRVAIVFSVR